MGDGRGALAPIDSSGVWEHTTFIMSSAIPFYIQISIFIIKLYDLSMCKKISNIIQLLLLIVITLF